MCIHSSLQASLDTYHLSPCQYLPTAVEAGILGVRAAHPTVLGMNIRLALTPSSCSNKSGKGQSTVQVSPRASQFLYPGTYLSGTPWSARLCIYLKKSGHAPYYGWVFQCQPHTEDGHWPKYLCWIWIVWLYEICCPELGLVGWRYTVWQYKMQHWNRFPRVFVINNKGWDLCQHAIVIVLSLATHGLYELHLTKYFTPFVAGRTLAPIAAENCLNDRSWTT